MQARRALFAALLCTASFSYAAQWGAWETDFDEEKKGWKEIEAQIPAYPQPKNLVLLEAGSATSHKFYVDTASISLGEDGVMRYTTVVKTGGGATNVSFEGIRCQTREKKLYALGRADGTWVRARDPKWQRVVLRDLTPHHWTLYREFFCPAPAVPTSPARAIEALKRGIGLAQSRASDE
jgi:CNP1-like family